MVKILKTDSKNPDFVFLVRKLDKYLAEIDGKDHSFYSKFNKIDIINHVIVAYRDDTPIGCGAFKEFDSNRVEIKRMYVEELERRNQIASMILSALEEWASQLGFNKTILETGISQVAAVKLYEKSNYKVIDNYGQYIGVDNSICFEKPL